MDKDVKLLIIVVLNGNYDNYYNNNNNYYIIIIIIIIIIPENLSWKLYPNQLTPVRKQRKQECIPVGCVPPAH